VLTQALDAETLRDLATMLQTELALIDAATTTTAFTDQLRWNAAYYRLGAGLPGAR
jgi:L-arabinose isomerase